MSYEPDFDKDPSKFYAGDLRSWGVELPERFPDCANVNRTAVIFGDPTIENTPEEIAKGLITTSIPVRFSEPFEWVTINLGPNGKPKPEQHDVACELDITDEPLPEAVDLPELHKRMIEETAALIEDETIEAVLEGAARILTGATDDVITIVETTDNEHDEKPE